MSVMPPPDKDEPSKITGSCDVGGNYTRHEQREFTRNLHAVLYSTADKNMLYFVKQVLLFRS